MTEDEKTVLEQNGINRSDYKVGTILVNSWGYDQTNVDFYEVTERPSPHFVIIREIGSKGVPGTASFMAESVVPVPGDYIGTPARKRITRWGVKVGDDHAWPTDPEKSHYSSHYA